MVRTAFDGPGRHCSMRLLSTARPCISGFAGCDRSSAKLYASTVPTFNVQACHPRKPASSLAAR